MGRNAHVNPQPHEERSVICVLVRKLEQIRAAYWLIVFFQTASGQRAVPSPTVALRLRLTPQQEAALENFFISSTKNINPVEMEILAAEMGISDADMQVRSWKSIRKASPSNKVTWLWNNLA